MQVLADAARGPEALGTHPESGDPVYVKTGRFGPYVQLGEAKEDGEKPKMVSLLAGMTPQDVTLAIAIKLLELPKSLGQTLDRRIMRTLVAIDPSHPGILDADFFTQLGDFLDRSIELCLQANPSIYAICCPASGIGDGVMGQRDDLQYPGLDVLGPTFWEDYVRRTRQW